MKYKSFKYAAMGACAAGALLAGTDAIAQSGSVVGSTVTAIVQNAINIAETTAMHFGTMVFLCDTAGANQSNIVLNPTTDIGVISNNGAALIINVDTTARASGTFDVTGAAPNTALTVTTANATNLSCPACATSVDLLLSALTDSGAGTVTTDANGDVTIGLGATLTTAAGACATQHQDGTYTGTFDITVNY